MRKIELEQGSERWLQWRRSLLTASDAASIMGVSPYTSIYTLWQRKLGIMSEQEETPAMRRGSELEPIARGQFIQEYNISMSPAVVESDEYNFLGASLDGISPCGRHLLEIKCNGKLNHAAAVSGYLPAHHKAQVQHQLLVTGAEKCYYYSFDGENGVCIEVMPDPEWIKEYIPKAKAFWEKVVFKESPEMTNKDYRHVNTFTWNHKAELYKDLCKQIEYLEEKKEKLRQDLIELCEGQSSEGNGIKVVKSVNKGRIDQEAIVKKYSIDVEEFRKASSESWRILIE